MQHPVHTGIGRGVLGTLVLFSYSFSHLVSSRLLAAPNASTAQKCCTAGLVLKGLKRTWDQNLSSGLMLLTFLFTHLFQFRFADSDILLS